MSTFHNRMGVVTLAVAATVLLLGAGCSKAKPSEPAAAPSSDAQATVDANANLPTAWAEYRSEKLGITIPYPEGWYVEEGTRGASTVILFDAQPLPSLDEPSDATAEVGVTIGSFSVADAVRSYGSGVRSYTVTLESRSVIRLDYDTELGAETGVRSRSVYLWEIDGSAIVVQGDANSLVLIRIAEDLASKQEKR